MLARSFRTDLNVSVNGVRYIVLCPSRWQQPSLTGLVTLVSRALLLLDLLQSDEHKWVLSQHSDQSEGMDWGSGLACWLVGLVGREVTSKWRSLPTPSHMPFIPQAHRTRFCSWSSQNIVKLLDTHYGKTVLSSTRPLTSCHPWWSTGGYFSLSWWKSSVMCSYSTSPASVHELLPARFHPYFLISHHFLCF